jgi:hypothetical protein
MGERLSHNTEKSNNPFTEVLAPIVNAVVAMFEKLFGKTKK